MSTTDATTRLPALGATIQRGGPVLVVHDGPWGRRVVVAKREGGRLTILAARRLDLGAAMGVQEIAGEHGAARVVRVAPARETIARTVTLPVAGGEEQQAAAASLLAEAQLPPALPGYRRAGGVIGEAAESSYSVLLTGWLSTSAPDALTSVPERWTTPIACLAALAEDSAHAAWYADRAEGAMCVLVPGPARVAARVLLDNQSDDAAWGAAVLAAVQETAPMAGLGGLGGLGGGVESSAAAGGVWLGEPLPEALRAGVKNLSGDPAWLSEFGVALGAALLATDARPSRAAMAALLASPPLIERSRGAVWVERYQSVPRSVTLIVLSVLLVCAAPLGLAWARARILSARVADIEKTSGGREQIEKKADLYTQLESARLPMTKLLMDVSRAAPVHVTIQNLRLAPGQGVTINGEAKTRAEVDEFTSSLSVSGVFSQVTQGRVENKGSSVEFDITAKVFSPHAPAKKADDFATNTLIKRLYPDGAPPPPPPAPAASAGGSNRGEGRNEGRGEDRAGNEPRRPTPSDGPPPEVSDEDIARMDLSSANRGWTTRKVYVQKNPTIDSALKERLQSEEQKMRARADVLRGGGT